jgi:predicted Zn-dependent protease
MAHKYYDGKTSTPHTARAQANEHFISIAAPTLSGRIQWKISETIVHQYPKDHLPAIIGNASSPDARLYIEDSLLFQQIQSALPKNWLQHIHLSPRTSIVWASAIAAIAVIGCVYVGFREASGWAAKLMPESWEHSLGDSVVNSMTEDRPICSGAEGRKVLEKTAQTLLGKKWKNTPIDIVVIDDPEVVNAFAAPGGFIVLYSGLITTATHPDEVTGVMAHEIGHVIHNHPMQGVIQGVGIMVFFQLVFGGSADSSTIATLTQQIATMSYSRISEREADETAADMLNHANINPAGLKQFFDRMEKHDLGGGVFSYFSTHPPMKERSKALESQIKSIPYQPSMTHEEWKSVRRICKTE